MRESGTILFGGTIGMVFPERRLIGVLRVRGMQDAIQNRQGDREQREGVHELNCQKWQTNDDLERH
jgi:hypothetical protein